MRVKFTQSSKKWQDIPNTRKNVPNLAVKRRSRYFEACSQVNSFLKELSRVKNLVVLTGLGTSMCVKKEA